MPVLHRFRADVEDLADLLGVLPVEQQAQDLEFARAQFVDRVALAAQQAGIPASSDYRQEYIDRAEGRTPSVIGSPYWD